MSETYNQISLGELISKVKEELATTNKESPAFMVENVELELQVTISKGQELKTQELKGQGEAKAKVTIGIVSGELKQGELKESIETNRKINRENIHKIKITLTPAILNDKLMANLPPEDVKKIQEASSKIIIQGDNDRI